jgi:hypothetical protein
MDAACGPDCEPDVNSPLLSTENESHPPPCPVSIPTSQTSAVQTDPELQQSSSRASMVDVACQHTTGQAVQDGYSISGSYHGCVQDGMGAVRAHMDKFRFSGSWSPSPAKHHINILELWAIHLDHVDLQQLLPQVCDHLVTVRCDSMFSYVNKMGGTRS